jgi:hypothetical protein
MKIFTWKESVVRGNWYLDLVSISDNFSYLYIYHITELGGTFGFELLSAFFQESVFPNLSESDEIYDDKFQETPRSLEKTKQIIEDFVMRFGHKILNETMQVYL